MQSIPLKLPDPVKFYLDLPLYDELQVAKDMDKAACEIVYYTGPMDAFCPECGAHSIFHRKLEGTVMSYDQWMLNNKWHLLFTCSRDTTHQMYFILQVNKAKRTLQKIGQMPSLASLSMYDVRKYASVLAPATFRELTKAIGLAAHGVGVGSFVYLRRIFEGLVEEASTAASLQPGWDEIAYAKSRMGEKILLLANHLPKFLVDNKAIYGILSKGIHELSESECLAAFPVVKIGIEIILDAKIEVEAQRKKLEAATRAIQNLASQQP